LLLLLVGEPLQLLLLLLSAFTRLKVSAVLLRLS
jgi:hypothetical protein